MQTQVDRLWSPKCDRGESAEPGGCHAPTNTYRDSGDNDVVHGDTGRVGFGSCAGQWHYPGQPCRPHQFVRQRCGHIVRRWMWRAPLGARRLSTARPSSRRPRRPTQINPEASRDHSVPAFREHRKRTHEESHRRGDGWPHSPWSAERGQPERSPETQGSLRLGSRGNIEEVQPPLGYETS